MPKPTQRNLKKQPEMEGTTSKKSTTPTASKKPKVPTKSKKTAALAVQYFLRRRLLGLALAKQQQSF